MIVKVGNSYINLGHMLYAQWYGAQHLAVYFSPMNQETGPHSTDYYGEDAIALGNILHDFAEATHKLLNPAVTIAFSGEYEDDEGVSAG